MDADRKASKVAVRPILVAPFIEMGTAIVLASSPIRSVRCTVLVENDWRIAFCTKVLFKLSSLLLLLLAICSE